MEISGLVCMHEARAFFYPIFTKFSTPLPLPIVLSLVLTCRTVLKYWFQGARGSLKSLKSFVFDFEFSRP